MNLLKLDGCIKFTFYLNNFKPPLIDFSAPWKLSLAVNLLTFSVFTKKSKQFLQWQLQSPAWYKHSYLKSFPVCCHALLPPHIRRSMKNVWSAGSDMLITFLNVGRNLRIWKFSPFWSGYLVSSAAGKVSNSRISALK